MQLDDICKENNDNDIRQVLRSLPRGLNETYARILERIIEHRKPDTAKKVLNWIAGARRPLHLEELVEAISFEPGDTLWDQGRRRFPISQTRMLQNCGNLVTVTHSEDGDVIQIVHYTAFEFLLSQSSKAVGFGFHMEMREANNMIGGVCVTYLSLADFETQVTSLPKMKAVNIVPSELIAALLPSALRRVWSFVARLFWQPTSQFDFGKILGPRTTIKLSDALKQKFRLLEYATEHWINHYSDLSPHSYDARAWRLFEDLTQSGRLPLPWELDDSSNDLPYAAQFRWAVRNGHAGIFMLTVRRVKEGIEEYIKLDCGGVTAIFLSCSLGHDVLVQMLLGYGCNLQERFQDRTVLQVAAAGGHLAVIDQLLQAKADVNEPAGSSCGRTALQAAAEQGHLAVIDRLLQAKADVNAPTGTTDGRTALQAAAEQGHLAVINRLLEAKADVNEPAGSSCGRTALQAAAEQGHLAVIDRLLQAKADVNAPTGTTDGRTALEAAAEQGHLAVINRLLQAKANVNAPAAEYDGRTALQAAARGGHLAVVDRLLQAKADVNAPAAEYDGQTALQAAAGGGHLAVVDRLLQAKADVNAPAAEYGGRTALQAAAGGGHLAVVDRLRTAGATE